MPRSVLIDEFHLSLFVPQHLTAHEQRAIQRMLKGTGFRARLVRAARLAPNVHRISRTR